jgi:hypothetical protein
LVDKADESAAGNAFDAASLFLFILTLLVFTNLFAADFEARLVATGCFALALVIRISVVAGHPSRPTAAAPQWPKAGGAGSCEPVSSRYERHTNAPLPKQCQCFLSNLVARAPEYEVYRSSTLGFGDLSNKGTGRRCSLQNLASAD